jgi:hypothetical protein
MTWRGKRFEEDDLNGDITGTLVKLTEVVETNNFVIFRCYIAKKKSFNGT